MEQKKNIYFDNPKDNTVFERCIDIMSKLMLKYGPDVLEKTEQEKREKVHCEETHNVL